MGSKSQESNKNLSWKWIPVIFLSWLCVQIGIFFYTKSVLPELQQVGFPVNFEQAQQFSNIMNKYLDTHYYTLLLFQSSNFLFLQTFCIPGTFIFNLLGGALFGVWVGFPVCVLCNTIGAFFCFKLSQYFGKDIVQKKLKNKVQFLIKKVEENRKDLFYFMLSTRIFPGSPNWMMNITFPHLGIPQVYFALSIFIGLMPWNFMTVEAGVIIGSFKSKDEIMQTKNYVLLISLALLCVLPSIVKKIIAKLTNKKQKNKQN